MPDLDTEQKPSRRLWILAGVAALALHVGCAALAIAHMQTDDPDDSLGAPAIEIGLEMMAPRSRPPTCRRVRIPTLPSRRLRSPSSRRWSRTPIFPRTVPTETEEPDRIVTTNDTKKPEKEEQEVAAVQTAGLDGIGRRRSHGNAELRSHSGRPALGRARAWAPAKARGACA